MKVALCYHGIAKGTNFKEGGLPVGYAKEFETIKKNLIEVNRQYQFDIYMHSWSIEHKDDVVAEMKPKSYSFESPKQLKKVTFFRFIKERTKKFFGLPYEFQRINNIYSRWFSYYKVCELVDKSGEHYDLVIVTRFDMCLLRPFNLENLDLNSFYSGEWIGYKKNSSMVQDNQLKKTDLTKLTRVQRGYPFNNEGIQDFFFVGSGKYMLKKFSRVFFELDNLIKTYGPSNHLVVLGKLKEDKMIKKYKTILKYSEDYFLSRWL